ncbi:MAG: SpoIIE family protein phosphatase [Clostridia bacterium]|nr:SpoIIE family protein phosphatase [Clostridia bacterium]
MWCTAYKKILDRFPEGVIVFDKKLRVRYTNAAFRRAFFIDKTAVGALSKVLSCDKGKCGEVAACNYCAVYRGMKRVVESGNEQTETLNTTIESASGAVNTISVRVRFYCLDEKKGLYIGVAGASYNTEFERDVLSAQRVQQRLLPAGKQAAGIPYAFAYVPCLQIGGDMPDVYELSGQAYGVLADVSGKGISAGMLSAFVKAGFDRKEPDLAVALQKLSGKFAELSQDERSYITVAAVRIDKETRLLRYAIAGHNAPILLKNRQGIHEIEHPAPPISNWFTDYEYEEKQLPYERGDMLVLLTDGVTECKGLNGELFGIERAESVLLQSRNAEDYIGKLRTALSVFCGGQFSDDITVIAFDL